LSSLGYKAGQVTGSLNEATKSAILQFEMDNGLSMDGVVDANLLHALQITASN
jgi:peptidoglycan hydrolase-like protein with peptidoglycan-binding domain